MARASRLFGQPSHFSVHAFDAPYPPRLPRFSTTAMCLRRPPSRALVSVTYSAVSSRSTTRAAHPARAAGRGRVCRQRRKAAAAAASIARGQTLDGAALLSSRGWERRAPPRLCRGRQARSRAWPVASCMPTMPRPRALSTVCALLYTVRASRVMRQLVCAPAHLRLDDVGGGPSRAPPPGR